MIKHYMMLILGFTIISCKQKRYAYVYDITNQLPIEGVLIKDMNNNKTSQTNKKGYFEIIYNQDAPKELLFIKEGYKIDTIPAYGCSKAGETSNTCFKGERIYLFKSN